MSTGPIPRKGVQGHAKAKLIHTILAASSAWGGATLYKGDMNYAVAANAAEATGGEWPIRGLDPNKKYKITHMRVVLGTAPGGGEQVVFTLRQNGSDSTGGVVTIAGAAAVTGEAAFQDDVVYGAYVTVKGVGSGGAGASTMKVYLTIEEM